MGQLNLYLCIDIFTWRYRTYITYINITHTISYPNKLNSFQIIHLETQVKRKRFLSQPQDCYRLWIPWTVPKNEQTWELELNNCTFKYCIIFIILIKRCIKRIKITRVVMFEFTACLYWNKFIVRCLSRTHFKSE